MSADDVEAQVNACLLRKGLNFCACAWRSVCRAVRGLKTFIACSGLGLLGLYDQLGGADLIQTLKNQFGDDAKIGGWLIGIALLFTVLRVVTKTGPGGDAKPPSDEGDTIETK